MMIGVRCAVCSRTNELKYYFCCEYHDAYLCWICHWTYRDRTREEDDTGTCTAPLRLVSPLDSVEDMAAELRAMIAEFAA